MRLPIDVNMMPIATDCDTLEEEDLDKTIQVLLDRRKRFSKKWRRIFQLHNRSKRLLLLVI